MEKDGEDIALTTNKQIPFPVKLVGCSTKWLVSGVVALSFLLLRNAIALNMVVGALVNAVLNKILKRVINEARPEGAKQTDPGMPSSHASSLAFLSVFSTLSLLTHPPVWWPSSPVPGTMLALTVLAYDFVSLVYRHLSGFHTIPQLVVGFSCGSLSSITWYALCESAIHARVQNDVLGGPGGLVPLSAAIFINMVGAVILSKK
eukprot:jgi/Bigna1/71877/fgenesh1_pg.17_\